VAVLLAMTPAASSHEQKFSQKSVRTSQICTDDTRAVNGTIYQCYSNNWLEYEIGLL
jgi:hypothetical protein